MSERALRAFDLRREGKTWAQIGAALGGVSTQRAYQLGQKGQSMMANAHAHLDAVSDPETLKPTGGWHHPISAWTLRLSPWLRDRLLNRTLTYTPGSDLPEELLLPHRSTRGRS